MKIKLPLVAEKINDFIAAGNDPEQGIMAATFLVRDAIDATYTLHTETRAYHDFASSEYDGESGPAEPTFIIEASTILPEHVDALLSTIALAELYLIPQDI